ncbi:serpentine type 7TM GPCR chemoreceptor srbc domain-containing protein [Ditylenchus destructor]|uniref:Serpentine type 7TM GPCR chemoreceptor srbc domain-containing protein n=1 Tax=Ditylenchus destructor TaxID=166010 RepID=A0AAD4MGW3_9BILA|nr:serpentine type 7TM GPCR chemoreceptor srbc domain-containing protein [Ditylenchus destructor]
MTGMYFMPSILVLVLTIDRCVALRFPFFYKTNMRMHFPTVAIVSLGIYYAINIGPYLLELPLQVDLIGNCKVFSCLIVKSKTIIQNTLKLIVGVMNLIATVYFLYALRHAGFTSTKNHVVKVALLIEVVLDVIPTLAVQIFQLIVGLPPSAYLGQYTLMLAGLNSAISGLYYFKIMTKNKKQSVKVNTFCNSSL